MRIAQQRTVMRVLAFVVVGLFGLSQVFIFYKFQAIGDGIDGLPIPDDVAGSGALAHSRQSTKRRKSVEERGAEITDTRSKFHRLPDGKSCQVSTSSSEIDTVSAVQKPFCLPWDFKSDEWWTRNFAWEVFHEDISHYCFRPIANQDKVNVLRAIYENQFRSDCSDPVYKKMWNSGLSKDFRNVVDGLKHVTEVAHRPFEVTLQPWHYASPKPFNISTAACSSQDMYCYFLPLSNCPRIPANETIKKIGFFDRQAVLGPRLFIRPARWYFEYISRPQTWLRYRVYKFVQQQKVVAPCTAMHVRRGDIITHGKQSRRYFSIAEYLNTSTQIERNVLLLTDDHNAIGEALHDFPNRNWMYIDRPRYRGSEGGFERHLPSNDPILEMTVLLSTFRLVRRCMSMIRASSAFGDLLWGEIKDEHQGENYWYKRVDENSMTIHDANNILISANISRAYDMEIPHLGA